MGNLLTSLNAVANAMEVVDRAIRVTSNNVTNAKTPGYVKQQLELVSKRFDLSQGDVGGVEAGQLISARKAYLDRNVFTQAYQFGKAGQRARVIEGVEPIFDISQQSGIAKAVDSLFGAFSNWSVTPNDQPARENVIRRAQDLAQSFGYSAASLGNLQRNVVSELTNAVNAVNRLGGLIREYNAEVRTDRAKLSDPGLDAQVHTKLEELSEYVDFNLIRGDDGAYTVQLGGQTPLVIGDQFHPIAADSSSANVVIRDHSGADITGQLRGGRIAALVEQRNSFLPSVVADLNRLARTMADVINQTLAGGRDRNNIPGAALFTYDASQGAAATLAVTGITPDELAAASDGAPLGNGNALTLASLATSKQISNDTFSQYFGGIAGRVGRELANTREDERTYQLLLAQARNVREEQTSVSLDEEAANLITFQRQYQANAELVRILNTLTDDTIHLLR